MADIQLGIDASGAEAGAKRFDLATAQIEKRTRELATRIGELDASMKKLGTGAVGGTDAGARSAQQQAVQSQARAQAELEANRRRADQEQSRRDNERVREQRARNAQLDADRRRSIQQQSRLDAEAQRRRTARERAAATETRRLQRQSNQERVRAIRERERLEAEALRTRQQREARAARDSRRRAREAARVQRQGQAGLVAALSSVGGESAIQAKDIRLQEQLNRAVKAGTITQREANRVRTAGVAAFRAQAVSAAAGTRGINRASLAVQRLSRVSALALGPLSGVGARLAALSSLIGGGLGLAGVVGSIGALSFIAIKSVQALAEFEASLSELEALTGLSGEGLEFLEKQALALGRTTTQTSTQVVQAFVAIGSLRPELLASAAALAEVTEQSIILAEASGQTVEQAGTALSQALNQFKLSSDQAATVADNLAQATRLGAVTSLERLSFALAKSGSAAAASGLSFQELVSTIQRVGQLGLPIQTIGTSLRNLFIRLSAGAKETNPRLVGLRQALNELARQGFEDPTRAAAKFGFENALVAAQMVQLRDTIFDLLPQLDKTGAALGQAATRTDNLKGDVKLLTSAYDGFLKTVGNTDAVRAATQALTDLLNTVTDLLSDSGGETAQGLVNRLEALRAAAEEPARGGLQGRGLAQRRANELAALEARLDSLRDIVTLLTDVVTLEEKLTNARADPRNRGTAGRSRITVIENALAALETEIRLAEELAVIEERVDRQRGAVVAAGAGPDELVFSEDQQKLLASLEKTIASLRLENDLREQGRKDVEILIRLEKERQAILDVGLDPETGAGLDRLTRLEEELRTRERIRDVQKEEEESRRETERAEARARTERDREASRGGKALAEFRERTGELQEQNRIREELGDQAEVEIALERELARLGVFRKNLSAEDVQARREALALAQKFTEETRAAADEQKELEKAFERTGKTLENALVGGIRGALREIIGELSTFESIAFDIFSELGESLFRSQVLGPITAGIGGIFTSGASSSTTVAQQAQRRGEEETRRALIEAGATDEQLERILGESQGELEAINANTSVLDSLASSLSGALGGGSFGQGVGGIVQGLGAAVGALAGPVGLVAVPAAIFAISQTLEGIRSFTQGGLTRGEGALAGAQTGAIFGPLGAAIGALVGALTANPPRRFQFQSATLPSGSQSAFAAQGVPGSFEGPFGVLSFLAKQRIGDNRQFADAILRFDQAIADRLSDRQIGAVSELLQSRPGGFFSLRTLDAADFAILINDRLRDILEGLLVDLGSSFTRGTTGFEGIIGQFNIGGTPQQQIEGLVDFLEEVEKFNEGLDDLRLVELSDVAEAIKNLEDGFGSLRDSAEQLGIPIENVQSAFDQGFANLQGRFLKPIQDQIVQLVDPFLSAIQEISRAEQDLLADAELLGLGFDEIGAAIRLQRDQLLEGSLAPIQSVLDLIQVDRSSPLETVDVLRDRLSEAIGSQDFDQIGQAASELLSTAQQTFGRTSLFFDEQVRVAALLQDVITSAEVQAFSTADAIAAQTAALIAEEIAQTALLEATVTTLGDIQNGFRESGGGQEFGVLGDQQARVASLLEDMLDTSRGQTFVASDAITAQTASLVAQDNAQTALLEASVTTLGEMRDGLKEASANQDLGRLIDQQVLMVGGLDALLAETERQAFIAADAIAVQTTTLIAESASQTALLAGSVTTLGEIRDGLSAVRSSQDFGVLVTQQGEASSLLSDVISTVDRQAFIASDAIEAQTAILLSEDLSQTALLAESVTTLSGIQTVLQNRADTQESPLAGEFGFDAALFEAPFLALNEGFQNAVLQLGDELRDSSFGSEAIATQTSVLAANQEEQTALLANMVSEIAALRAENAALREDLAQNLARVA
jgi:hypothetical protein